VAEVGILDIDGVKFTNSTLVKDERGFVNKYLQNISEGNLQENFNVDSLLISRNLKTGTLRGMHFQSHPHQEEKIVTCASGKILDVVVDLRPDSATFGKWAKVILNSAEPIAIYIPKGLAHGFQTLTKNSVVLYAISTPYIPSSSFVLSHNDPLVGIVWPRTVTTMSKRDLEGLDFQDAVKANVG